MNLDFGVDVLIQGSTKESRTFEWLIFVWET
jgi:hypothetical protein